MAFILFLVVGETWEVLSISIALDAYVFSGMFGHKLNNGNQKENKQHDNANDHQKMYPLLAGALGAVLYHAFCARKKINEHRNKQ